MFEDLELSKNDLKILNKREFNQNYPHLYEKIKEIIKNYLNVSNSFHIHKLLHKILNRNLENLKFFKRLDVSELIIKSERMFNNFNQWLENKTCVPVEKSLLDIITQEIENSGEIELSLKEEKDFAKNKYFYNHLYLLKQHFYYSSNAVNHFQLTLQNQIKILKKYVIIH